MIEIQRDTEMLLFRYRDYGKTDFITEHLKVIQSSGHVWMLKIGKKTSENKLNQILASGGWLILRAPKAKGSKSYIAQFTDFSDEEPEDMVYPEYYNTILEDDEGEYYGSHTVYQWFCLKSIMPIPAKDSEALVLSKTNKNVNDVIGTTRTAVMYVRNEQVIII